MFNLFAVDTTVSEASINNETQDNYDLDNALQVVFTHDLKSGNFQDAGSRDLHLSLYII